MEASSVVMRCDEDMVGAGAPVPVRELAGDPPDGRLEQAAGMAEGREPGGAAEVAGDIDGDEEEVGLRRVQRPEPPTPGQRPVDGNLRREEVAGAPLVGEPVGVVRRRQLVDVHLEVHSGELVRRRRRLKSQQRGRGGGGGCRPDKGGGGDGGEGGSGDEVVGEEEEEEEEPWVLQEEGGGGGRGLA